MRFRVRAVLALLPVVILSGSASAGQIASHIYTALRTRDHMSAKCRSIVDSNLEAYLAGAQGPDITGVVQHGLGSLSTMPTPTVGEESHYDKTGELTLNILVAARTDAQKAFALGWITHYINDQYVHSLVNRYGGYYKSDAARHKALEQLESKYVYAEKAALVDKTTATSCPADLGANFAGFLLQGYNWTFPDNKLYVATDKVGVEGVYDDTRLSHFCGQFQRAASWCLSAAKDFYTAHESGNGEHDYTNTYIAGFPNMPTKEQYQRLMKPLKVEVKPGAQELEVKVTVLDNRLHGRFCAEWDEAIERAVDHAGMILPAVCEYVEAKDAVERNNLRPALKPLLPDVNLDQPLASFDVAKIEPGNVRAEEIIWEYQPVLKSGSLNTDPQKVKTGKVKIPKMQEDGFDGGKRGEVTFKIQVPSDKQDYKLRIKLVPNASYEGLDYVDYDSSTKQAQTLGPGEVMLGDIFDVRFELPPSIAADPRDRRYVIMADDASITLEDGMNIQGSFDNGKFRYDVVCLEDRVEGGDLHAKLQVTDLNNEKLLGRQNLTVVRFDKGKASLDLSGMMKEATAAMDAASEAMEAANKALDLTEEQEQELEKRMEAYEAQLNKDPKLTEEDKEQLMFAKAQELMKEMGKDPAALLESNQSVQELSEMAEAPFNESTKITFRPAEVQVTAAQGWAASPGKPLYAQKSLEKIIEQKSGSGVIYLKLNAAFSVSFTNNEETESSFKQNHAGGDEKAIPIEIAGFKGVVYEKTSTSEKEWHADNSNLAEGEEPDQSASFTFAGNTSANGLLRKGKVLMRVFYGCEVQSSTSIDKKGNVVYDGFKPGKAEYEKAKSGAEAMLRSIRLVPGPLPR